MLVLSRKPDQEFVFPKLGISIRLLKVDGRQVRIGVEAPREIEVLRGELVQATDDLIVGEFDTHEMRNRLNTVKLQLHLSEQLLNRHQFEEADIALREAVHQLSLLEREAAGVDDCKKSRKCKDRILVVDDDVNELRLMGGILELEGYCVKTAADGVDALEKLQEHPFDIVMLDMHMPRCSGPETVRHIRSNADWRHLMLLSVSGSSPSEFNIPIGSAGVDAWFTKPLDPAGLIKDLARMRADMTNPMVKA